MKSDYTSIIALFVILLIVFGIGYYYTPKFKDIVDSASSSIGSIINIQQDIKFAGYNWDVTAEGTLSYDYKEAGASSNCQISKDNDGFITLESSSSSGEYRGSGGQSTDVFCCMTTKEEISDIDEFLPMWKGSGSGSTSHMGGGGSNSVMIGLYDKITGKKIYITSRGCSTNSNSPRSCSWVQEPSISKFMNNFDKTYSSYIYLGIGDVYLKEQTFNTSNWNSRHLQLCASTSAKDRTGSKSQLTIFNIVTKRLETPICKVGQVPLPNGSCEELNSILLARESAIYESLEEKINRIEERLQAREEGLQKQINELEELLKASNKEEQLNLINKALEELNQKLIIATDTTQIESLKSQIINLKNQIDLLEDEKDIERIEEQIYYLQQQLELSVKSAEADQIKSQINFYESQLALLTLKSDERFDYLNNELTLTKQILNGIQSGEITPPPDVDIEEVVKKVLDKIEIKETVIQRGLTDGEVKDLINDEINSQFQQRFPSGLKLMDEKPSIPIWVWIVGIALILIIIRLFSKK